MEAEDHSVILISEPNKAMVNEVYCLLHSVVDDPLSIARLGTDVTGMNDYLAMYLENEAMYLENSFS